MPIQLYWQGQHGKEQSSQTQYHMPEYNPSSIDNGIHYHFIGFINLVYILIKIIINDIPCSSNEYRCKQN